MSVLRTGAAHNAPGSGAAFYAVGLGICLMLLQLSCVCKVRFPEIVFSPSVCLDIFKKTTCRELQGLPGSFPDGGGDLQVGFSSCGMKIFFGVIPDVAFHWHTWVSVRQFNTHCSDLQTWV